MPDTITLYWRWCNTGPGKMHSDKSFDIMAKLYEQKIFLNSGKIQKGKVLLCCGWLGLVIIIHFWYESTDEYMFSWTLNILRTPSQAMFISMIHFGENLLSLCKAAKQTFCHKYLPNGQGHISNRAYLSILKMLLNFFSKSNIVFLTASTVVVSCI